MSATWKEWLQIPSANTVVHNATIPGSGLIKTGFSRLNKSTVSIVKGSTQRLLVKPTKMMELVDPDECEHRRVDTSQSEPICDDCGIMIKVIMNDASGSKGESRCFHHNSNPRDISADLHGLHILESVQRIAQNYYLNVINYDDDTGKGDTRRKIRRRAIIAACIDKAYIDIGAPKSQEEIARMFNISVSDLNKKGKKAVSPLNVNPLGGKSASPMDKIPAMLKRVEYLNLGSSALGNIRKLWSYIHSLSGQKDHNFDSRRPKSMAAALVYFYAKLKLSKAGVKDKFDIAKFSEAVNVSTNTYVSIAQSIAPTISGAENLSL